MENIIEKLQLTDFFPCKITLEILRKKSVSKVSSLSDIPWHFLYKLGMVNYKGRDDMISRNINDIYRNASDNPTAKDSAEEMIDMFEVFNLESESSHQLQPPHPMDVVVAVFRCCSMTVRQLLCEKMFVCKLSIPIVLPPYEENKSLFLLWALRNIAMESRIHNGQLQNSSVVSIPMPVVSCIRLGEISRSKSQFLNEMVNGQSHDAFFHRDCQNGMNDRILTDGLIEIAWHIASLKSEHGDNSGETTAYFNLRGDGTSQERNVIFLSKISNVVLVMIDLCQIEKPSIISTLNTIRNSDAVLYIMVTKLPSVKYGVVEARTLKEFFDSMKGEHFKRDNLILDFNAKGCINSKDLKMQTEEKMSQYLRTIKCTQTLERCRDEATSLQMAVDEDHPECIQSKDLAVEVLNTLDGCGIHDYKMQMLPLQGKPWRDWATLNKEQHRREKKCSENLTSYMDNIYMEKNQKRKEQLELLLKPSTFFDSFLKCLLNLGSDTRFYFLKWIKLYLDDMSKQVLPELHDECLSKWNAIRQCDDRKEYLKLEKKLNWAEQKLSESSLGLEHLMREMAQMYEAVDYMKEEVSEDIKSKVTNLPSIMAELILQGFPLEIVDGDVGHIPIKWVKDVLEQLGNILGNKKIFVLSVLGIQSSGKSTLLNAMFGLQFEVAAGRCTRGVYAQLLPLSEEFSTEKYDYILVIDTEGLRANELGRVKLQHDNEIATLVTGIGDVTLVNIKGENVSEIEDILQIVIHALLKMKLVNKSLELQPSCFFIHQNVPAVDAAQKLRSGQQVFMETLDRVTRAAAREEDAPQFTKFGQVIEFDINTCITYFSDLWEGDPPMAPVNPGYSKCVNNAKQTLLTSIMDNRASQLTLCKLSQKLTDLWNGILDQNFIFSFRNTLELGAYSTLERELADLVWSLKDAALIWQNSIRNQIITGEMDANLNLDVMNECFKNLQEGYLKVKEKLENFFVLNEKDALLEQWRRTTFFKLENRYNEVVHRTVSAVRDELGIRKIQIDQKKDIQEYKDNLMEEAKKLAEGLKSDIPCEELKERFDQRWQVWKSKMSKSFKMDHINIQDTVYNILTERYEADKAMVISSWDEIQKKQSLTIYKFSDNIKYAIERNSKDNSLVQRMVSMFNVHSREYYLDAYAHKISIEFDMIIDCHKQNGFTEEFALKIVDRTKIVINRLKNSMNLKNEEVLTISIAIFACQYACYKCQDRDRALNENTMASLGIHPIFENVLRETMPSILLPVFYELQDYCQAKWQSLASFQIDEDKHLCLTERNSVEELGIFHVEQLVRRVLEKVKTYVQKREIHAFREEYIEEVMKMVEQLITREGLFTKQFKIDLIVHACLSVIPDLNEKQQRYLASTDAGAVFERDYYTTYYEMFKNFYHKFTGEKGLAMVLTQRLCKLVETTIDNDMARELACDVRNNVEQLKMKSVLLEAVLQKLLEEDQFDEFYLYLTNIDACLQKWIAWYINSYLFTETSEGNNRYVTIASKKVESLISQITQEILRLSMDVPEFNSKAAVKKWTRKFHRGIRDQLPLPLYDLQSMMGGYDVSSLLSFTDTLISKLLESRSTIVNRFKNHDVNHLQTAHEDSVYKLIAQECKGCTEMCPFCAAPCILNTVGHFEQDVPIQHIAKEHYPRGCGRRKWMHTNMLIIENCSTAVASNNTFMDAFTNGKYHPYKTYYKIHPSWKIHGDPSIETSPYWKWFLAKYGDRMAKKMKAGNPKIPKSWRRITKEKANNSTKS